MKTYSLILILLLFFTIDVTAQSDSSLRKIDINISYVSQGDLIQPLVGFYPLSYHRVQFGISSGFDRMKVSKSDTFSIQEKRIPLLASVKYNITLGQELYFKG